MIQMLLKLNLPLNDNLSTPGTLAAYQHPNYCLKHHLHSIQEMDIMSLPLVCL